MSSCADELSDNVVSALRRVIRAVDLHSRQLARSRGLTSPQALVLKALVNRGEMAVGSLAREVSLSQATVTDILNRLQRRDFIVRTRSTADKRRVLVSATSIASELIKESPPLLQERFLEKFRALEQWEQLLLLSSLQRIASMMDASDIDAEPILASGPEMGLEDPPRRAPDNRESADTANSQPDPSPADTPSNGS